MAHYQCVRKCYFGIGKAGKLYKPGDFADFGDDVKVPNHFVKLQADPLSRAIADTQVTDRQCELWERMSRKQLLLLAEQKFGLRLNDTLGKKEIIEQLKRAAKTQEVQPEMTEQSQI